MLGVDAGVYIYDVNDKCNAIEWMRNDDWMCNECAMLMKIRGSRKKKDEVYCPTSKTKTKGVRFIVWVGKAQNDAGY